PPPLPLRITSEPPGARVLLDGREIGSAPVEHRFEAGVDYELRLELAGYEAAGWRFSLADLSDRQRRDRQLVFPLKSTVPPGVLSVAAAYPVAVQIGGRRFAAATSHDIPLAPGRYRVELVAPEVFLRQTYPVALDSGDRQALQAPAAVEIRISAQPSNCRLEIDGRALDDPMPLTVRLAAGRHTFQFIWPDGRRKRLTRTISAAARPIHVTPE
ncbi:MAG: PEGA domain-containing protein, partial [Acidobacteria bacterium]